MVVARSVALGAIFAAGASGVIAQGLPELEREFPNGSTLRFYGQINKGFLNYDDGVDSETYDLIDNDNSSTRFGLEYTQPFGEWTFTNTNEFEYAPYSTGNINIENDSPSSEDYELSEDNIRKIEFALENERFGVFWLGQGSMATDGIAEVDLSGTDVIGYSSVGDSAAAQLFRYTDIETSFGPQVGDAFTNYDGGRLFRIRYDSPSFSGFSVAVAYGRDLLSDDEDERDLDQYDIGLTYENEFDVVEVGAALGYYRNEDDISIWAGSASALHTPTGLNATLAAGLQDADGQEGQYWYGKLGLLREVFPLGASAVAVDYYAGDDIFTSDGVEVFDGDGNPVLDDNGDAVAGDITSSDSESWGLSLVQNIDAWNTELWLTYRTFDYSDNFASYEDGQAIFGGARFSF